MASVYPSELSLYSIGSLQFSICHHSFFICHYNLLFLATVFPIVLWLCLIEPLQWPIMLLLCPTAPSFWLMFPYYALLCHHNVLFAITTSYYAMTVPLLCHIVLSMSVVASHRCFLLIHQSDLLYQAPRPLQTTDLSIIDATLEIPFTL